MLFKRVMSTDRAGLPQVGRTTTAVATVTWTVL